MQAAQAGELIHLSRERSRQDDFESGKLQDLRAIGE
jgi:hypothetical protein